MQDFAVMNVLYGQGHLHEPVEDLVFAVADLANLLLVVDLRVEVAAVGIVHHDAQTALVHE